MRGVGGKPSPRSAPPHAVHLPGADDTAGRIQGLQLHAVGMRRQKFFRFPDQLHGGRRQRLTHCLICQMALARGRQTTEERDPIARRPRILLAKGARRPLWPHGVTAGRPDADAKQLTQ